jgi:hypothetical protein
MPEKQKKQPTSKKEPGEIAEKQQKLPEGFVNYHGLKPVAS